MSKQPASLLSLQDLTGQPLAEDLMWRSFRKLMADNGYVVFRNVPDEFDPVGFCHELGEFIPLYTGVLVGDVIPEPGMDNYYHAGNTKELVPHNEGYDFPVLPPRYLALWCVHPAAGSGGETTLADGYRWLASLTEVERRQLRERSYEFTCTDALRSMGINLRARHPVLEEHDGIPIVRMSCNNIVGAGSDQEVTQLAAKVAEFFRRSRVAIDYDTNDMLVFDNWRMLHARNAFNDNQRHLKRIQIGMKRD